jgi:enoyl-CoA hydratase/carnithine racemase
MEHIKFDVSNFIASITLNRPEKLNAVTPAMSDALVEMIQEFNRRDDVRVLVLSGAGEKAFCAGSDIAELDTYASPWAFRNRPDYCDAIRGSRKPVVCAINGYALGGGLETAMSCDIRIAADHARLGSPEVKLGWIGGGGMAYMLAHSIGPSNAAMMLMGGDHVSAQQALQWGLVSELHNVANLVPRAMEIASTIASRPPVAVETAKANLRAAYAMPLEMAIQYERDLQTVCFATEDATEGRTAFKERRPASFKGR